MPLRIIQKKFLDVESSTFNNTAKENRNKDELKKKLQISAKYLSLNRIKLN